MKVAYWVEMTVPSTYTAGGVDMPCNRNIQVGVVADGIQAAIEAVVKEYPDGVIHSVNKRGNVEIIV